jgi:hypothetical protein
MQNTPFGCGLAAWRFLCLRNPRNESERLSRILKSKHPDFGDCVAKVRERTSSKNWRIYADRASCAFV